MTSESDCNEVLVFVVAVLVGVFVLVAFSSAVNSYFGKELDELQHEIMRNEREIESLRQQRQQLIKEKNDLLQWMREKFEIRQVIVTAYAPLDFNAVQGVCYSGDRNITASGQPPVPGQTAAGGHAYAFGDIVWIEGVGTRVINDRGGMVSGYNIDIVVATQKEAYAFGRQTLWVIYEKNSQREK